MGGEVQAFYAILGSEYDTLFIVKAPSDEKVAEMALAIARLADGASGSVDPCRTVLDFLDPLLGETEQNRISRHDDLLSCEC